MSTAKSNFDPRQALEGIVDYVKDMATSNLGRASKPQPNQERIEGAVLASLESGSKTAAQVSVTISISAGGTWTPTNGQIHAALSRLTDADLISVKTKGDRKFYSITKPGEESLAAIRQKIAEVPMSDYSNKADYMNWLNCEANFFKSASKLPAVIVVVAQNGSKEQQAMAAEILDKARHDLHKLLAEN